MKEVLKKIMAVLTIGVFLGGAVRGNICENTVSAEAIKTTSVYGVGNPVVTGEAPYTVYSSEWDCVEFGSYWQNDTNGDGVVDQKDKKQPIKWRVLSVDGSEAFLVADQILDFQCFYDQTGSTTWKNSTIRNWLNDTFYDSAFTNSEKTAILTTTVFDSEETPEFYEGQDLVHEAEPTDDKVFLLSRKEFTTYEYGFDFHYGVPHSTRIAACTDYALSVDPLKTCTKEIKRWWLRSQAYKNAAGVVEINGECYGSQIFGPSAVYGVRPAIHIDLNSNLWELSDKIYCNNFRENDEKFFCVDVSKNYTSYKYGKNLLKWVEDEDGYGCLTDSNHKDLLTVYMPEDYGYDELGTVWWINGTVKCCNFEYYYREDDFWGNGKLTCNELTLYDDEYTDENGEVQQEPVGDAVALIRDNDTGYVKGILRATGETVTFSPDKILKKLVTNAWDGTSKVEQKEDESEENVSATSSTSAYSSHNGISDNAGNSILFSSSVSDSNSKETISKVNLAKIKSLKVKVSGKKAKVSWKKIKSAAGYQIQYALNKKFTKGKKNKTTKKTALTIRGLKSKKTYYIRVRAYVKTSSKKIYSKWSKVIKKKVKK